MVPARACVNVCSWRVHVAFVVARVCVCVYNMTWTLYTTTTTMVHVNIFGRYPAWAHIVKNEKSLVTQTPASKRVSSRRRRRRVFCILHCT